MGTYINDDVIEEIRSRTDIVGLISEYVTLKKAGKYYQAFCPFHEDRKTPSFKVSESKQSFHCFGCNKGGDIFSFIQFKENLEFPEAVKWLAERAGVELRSEPISENKKRDKSLAQEIAAVNELACNYFIEQLGKSKAARDYLSERGLSKRTIERFRLGYAPDAWEGLVNRLQKEQVSLATAESAGLVRSRDSGGFYDLFRGRIVFPIMDLQGRIIGFGGRTLAEVTEVNPKYYNTPETVLYKKSNNLYGLYQAREAIEAEGAAILVEGNISLLTPVEAGFENTVAPLGTAFTDGQLRLLVRRNVKKLIVAFDGDEAGTKAALRAAELCLQNEMPAVFVRFEKGMDPDDTIRRDGPQKFQEFIDSATGLFDFVISEVEKQASGEKFGHGSFIELITPFLAKTSGPMAQEQFISRVAGRTGYVGPDAIRRQIKAANDKKYNRPAPEEEASAKAAPRYNRQTPEQTLALLFWNVAETRKRIAEAAPYETAENPEAETLVILNAMIACYDDHGALDYRRMLDYINDEKQKEILSRLILIDFSIDESDIDQMINDCLNGAAGLRAKSLKQAIRTVHLKIVEAEKNRDSRQILELMQDMQQLKEELRNIQLGDNNGLGEQTILNQ